MLFLVMGPRSNDIVGFALSKEKAREIARELNGMLDEMGDNEDCHYGVKQIKAAWEHLDDCRAMGFAF